MITLIPVDMNALGLPSAKDMIQRIYGALETRQPKFGYWATKTKTCRRQLLYLKRNTPIDNPIGARASLVFEIGDLFELFMIDKIRKSLADFGLKVHSEQLRIEVPFSYQHPETGETITRKISGKVDILVGNHVIAELKSANKWTIDEVLKQGHPREDHYSQTQTYFDGMQVYKEAGFDPKAIWCIYVSKDDERIIGFEYGEDPLDLETSKQRFIDVEIADIQGNLLPRDFHFDQWQCQYCAFLNRCWGIDKDAFKDKTFILDLPWLEPIILEYEQAVDWRKTFAKIEEKLKDEITGAFIDNKVRAISAGVRIAFPEATQQTRTDTKKIPEEIRAQFIKVIDGNRLDIKERLPGALKSSW